VKRGRCETRGKSGRFSRIIRGVVDFVHAEDESESNTEEAPMYRSIHYNNMSCNIIKYFTPPFISITKTILDFINAVIKFVPMRLY